MIRTVCSAIVCLVVMAAVWTHAQQPGGAATPAPAGRGGGQGRGGGDAGNANGYLTYDKSLPQGWAVRDYLKSINAQMPLWNKAKQKLLDGKQIYSHTISRLDVEGYCQAAPHYDYTFFEMQHSTMSFADIEKMIAACPRVGVPVIRVANEFEDTIQKAVDIGAIGIFVPTVDTVEKAESVARYARFPPLGRRSAGANQAASIWGVDGINFRQTVNPNMLLVMMIETPTGVANAYDIARIPGVDALIVANSDLGNFSGFRSGSPQYEALVTQIKESALTAGKFIGAVTGAYSTQGGVPGRTDWADFRMNYSGPAFDGWKPPAGRGGRGAQPPVNPQSKEVQ
jgi:2-keto-3-deoxy-L-rhamnonate aldolase RhmA